MTLARKEFNVDLVVLEATITTAKSDQITATGWIVVLPTPSSSVDSFNANSEWLATFHNVRPPAVHNHHVTLSIGIAQAAAASQHGGSTNPGR
jgi:hypothetical protein